MVWICTERWGVGAAPEEGGTQILDLVLERDVVIATVVDGYDYSLGAGA